MRHPIPQRRFCWDSWSSTETSMAPQSAPQRTEVGQTCRRITASPGRTTDGDGVADLALGVGGGGVSGGFRGFDRRVS
ncbi:hypothetical protein Vadar_028020 [Vaccinium darrowii]|uniref:Uncharacterized protein n=1 Tax=Vaccinium darrowii TaxID=229202 RepID=A0ACB7Y307_9ERIC|nr:hypothetical protein Vadar_028020 [Vaccinium darrowii]